MSTPRERRAARQAPNLEVTTEPRPRRRVDPITPAQVTDAALGIVAAEGYDALTMRRVAAALDTGPASLYAHVVNKADLDELLIGRLCAEVVLPAPDAAEWRSQICAVCTQLRDQYLTYPGISRATYAMAPTDVEILRLSEGMLAILLTGGVAPQAAAWAVDALLLYVAAYCLEASVARRGPSDELLHRLAALPVDTFPQTSRYAAEVTAGDGHERFDFTLDLMIDGLTYRSGCAAPP